MKTRAGKGDLESNFQQFAKQGPRKKGTSQDQHTGEVEHVRLVQDVPS